MTTLVTGGAGFIGGELVSSLVAQGEDVVVIDSLVTARESRSRGEVLAGSRLVVGDVRERSVLRRAMRGCDRVIHFASSTDILGGASAPGHDFGGIVEATEVVCEIAAELGVRELWYASSGVVYGRAVPRPSREDAGPLLPESHYAAGKLASEAIVSGYAHLLGWRALVFRFGNTIGGGSDHGLVHDLVVKLLRSPGRLDILGDGTQRKPYLHVDDLVAALHRASERTPVAPVVALNVGTPGSLTVQRVAELVVDALAAGRRVELSFTEPAPGGGGWPGDTPVVEFDTSAIEATGWRPMEDAESAVRRAAIETAARYQRDGLPLITSLERNVMRRRHEPESGDASAA